MNDDGDVFAIFGVFALGLMLAVVALVGVPEQVFTLVLLLLALGLPAGAVVAAVLITRQRRRDAAAARSARKASELVAGVQRSDRPASETGEVLRAQSS